MVPNLFTWSCFSCLSPNIDSQTLDVSQVVTHLFEEFHLLFQEMVLQEVTEIRVCAGRTQGVQIQKNLVWVLFQDQGSFHDVLSFTLLILGRLHQVLKRMWPPH